MPCPDKMPRLEDIEDLLYSEEEYLEEEKSEESVVVSD